MRPTNIGCCATPTATKETSGQLRGMSFAICDGKGVGWAVSWRRALLDVRVSARWHLSVPPVLTLAKLPVLPAEVIVRKPQRPDPEQSKRERRSRLVKASVGMQLVQVT